MRANDRQETMRKIFGFFNQKLFQDTLRYFNLQCVSISIYARLIVYASSRPVSKQPSFSHLLLMLSHFVAHSSILFLIEPFSTYSTLVEHPAET